MNTRVREERKAPLGKIYFSHPFDHVIKVCGKYLPFEGNVCEFRLDGFKKLFNFACTVEVFGSDAAI